MWEEWDDNLIIQTEDSMETDMIRQEHVAQLHTAIAMMPEKDRMVLLLSVVEELSTEEMSQVLGIKSSTVRSQLARAKQKLIKFMQR
jgi:RNA polymerase sigma-70 factor (ECF subfamily)